MFSPKFTITNRTTAALTRIERARGFLEAANISETWIKEMSQEALLKEAHYTTHIEGTRLTLEQAERIFEGEFVPGSDPDDVRELLNYRTAFDLVTDYMESQQPMREGLIREIHRRLVDGVRGGAAEPGRYRTVQNYVYSTQSQQVVYQPPPPQDVPVLMQEFVEWLNDFGEIHPVLASGIAQFQLVHIHPFVDGNGRTSRLLSTLCLYRFGYDFKRLFTISEYYDRDRTAFYQKIQGVRDSGMDLTDWLEFFVQGLSTQLTEAVEKGKRTILKDVIARNFLLNPRQTQAVGHILDHGKVMISDLEKLCTGTTRRTLQRDMKQLIEKGVCLEIRSSPTDPTNHYVLSKENVTALSQ